MTRNVFEVTSHLDSSTLRRGVSEVANRSPFSLHSQVKTWPGFSATSVSSPEAMSSS